MHIYRGHLELLDYVFFATIERGKVYETGAFIHNYALVYALGLARDVPYSHLRQEPRYAEELSGLNGRVYLTPATPLNVGHRLVQWNAIGEKYGFPGKPASLGYPDWGFARVLRPGGQFLFYLLLNDLAQASEFPALRELLAGKQVRIRLGKFMGKARIHLEEPSQISDRTDAFVSQTLLNWRDLPSDPLVCDVVATALPTRLLNNAHFGMGAHLRASFLDGIIDLPADMRFLARLPDKGKAR